MDKLSRAELFIIREYEIKSKQMQHEDYLRNHLLRYAITFFTLIITSIFYLFIRGYLNGIPDRIKILIFIFLLLIAMSIWGIVIIIAKIRNAQLLWMNINANIRNYFFGEKYELYNVTILSDTTIRPEPNLSNPSQTLITVIIISVLNSFYVCSLIILFGYHSSLICLFGIFLLLLIGHLFSYKKVVTLHTYNPYSKINPPWNQRCSGC